MQADIVWILTFAVVVWIGYAVVRALIISARTRQQPRSAADEFSRAEKVRQDVRRKKAERKANQAAVPPARRAPVAARPGRRVSPLDPFGGPWRQWLRRWLGRRDGDR